jgi:hypothetical protein
MEESTETKLIFSWGGLVQSLQDLPDREEAFEQDPALREAFDAFLSIEKGIPVLLPEQQVNRINSKPYDFLYKHYLSKLPNYRFPLQKVLSDLIEEKGCPELIEAIQIFRHGFLSTEKHFVGIVLDKASREQNFEVLEWVLPKCSEEEKKCAQKILIKRSMTVPIVRLFSTPRGDGWNLFIIVAYNTLQVTEELVFQGAVVAEEALEQFVVHGDLKQFIHFASPEMLLRKHYDGDDQDEDGMHVLFIETCIRYKRYEILDFLLTFNPSERQVVFDYFDAVESEKGVPDLESLRKILTVCKIDVNSGFFQLQLTDYLKEDCYSSFELFAMLVEEFKMQISRGVMRVVIQLCTNEELLRYCLNRYQGSIEEIRTFSKKAFEPNYEILIDYGVFGPALETVECAESLRLRGLIRKSNPCTYIMQTGSRKGTYCGKASVPDTDKCRLHHYCYP